MIFSCTVWAFKKIFKSIISVQRFLILLSGCAKLFGNNVIIRGSSESRQVVGIPGDQRVVVTFGLVNSIKKPDICVRAIAKLAEDGVESHLYFVGGSDEVIQNELNTLAKQLGVRQLIHFLQDWIPDEEYIHYILAADAVVSHVALFSTVLRLAYQQLPM